jgi:N-acetylglutamate synthase-like GNAT family acetyltransferase
MLVKSISMVRVSREPFPAFALPPGFSLAWYQPGCEAWWYDIQLHSDELTPITRDTFAKYFGQPSHNPRSRGRQSAPSGELGSSVPAPVGQITEASQELARRQCYLLDAAGHPIGTATAWFEDNYHGEVWGRLHWVAILPEWQGRGLGKALMSAVCERLHELHPERSFLRTTSQRLAAIHLYLKFGFEPEFRTPEDKPVWKDILARLSQRPL